LWRTCRRVRKDVEALFHDQPADEADRRHVVFQAEAAPPFEVAPAGVENLPVDAARPDPDVVVHPLVAEQLRHRIGGREDRVAAAVEPAHRGEQNRLQERHSVIARVGFEPGVDRGDHRQVPFVRERDRAMAGDVGAGDVQDVGLERLQIPAHPRRDPQAELILGTAGNRQSGDVDEVAPGLEGGLLHRRRIDAHRRALAQQIVGEPVQRLVGPVADIIVIAAEDGDAKVGDLHEGAGIGRPRP